MDAYQEMTVAKLKALASKNKIDLGKATKKGDIIDILLSNKFESAAPKKAAVKPVPKKAAKKTAKKTAKKAAKKPAKKVAKKNAGFDDEGVLEDELAEMWLIPDKILIGKKPTPKKSSPKKAIPPKKAAKKAHNCDDSCAKGEVCQLAKGKCVSQSDYKLTTQTYRAESKSGTVFYGTKKQLEALGESFPEYGLSAITKEVVSKTAAKKKSPVAKKASPKAKVAPKKKSPVAKKASPKAKVAPKKKSPVAKKASPKSKVAPKKKSPVAKKASPKAKAAAKKKSPVAKKAEKNCAYDGCEGDEICVAKGEKAVCENPARKPSLYITAGKNKIYGSQKNIYKLMEALGQKYPVKSTEVEDDFDEDQEVEKQEDIDSEYDSDEDDDFEDEAESDGSSSESEEDVEELSEDLSDSEEAPSPKKASPPKKMATPKKKASPPKKSPPKPVKKASPVKPAKKASPAKPAKKMASPVKKASPPKPAKKASPEKSKYVGPTEEIKRKIAEEIKTCLNTFPGRPGAL